jgi:hypothetical protein
MAIHVADVRVCMACGRVPVANDRKEYTAARAMMIVLVKGFCVCSTGPQEEHSRPVQDLGTAVVSVSLPARKVVKEPDEPRPAADLITPLPEPVHFQIENEVRVLPSGVAPFDPPGHQEFLDAQLVTAVFPAPTRQPDGDMGRKPALTALMTGGTDPRGIKVSGLRAQLAEAEKPPPAVRDLENEPSILTDEVPVVVPEPKPAKQPVPETGEHVPPGEVTSVMDPIPPLEPAEPDPSPKTELMPAQPEQPIGRRRGGHPSRARRRGKK